MPYRDTVTVIGPLSPQPTSSPRTWRLVHHRGPNLRDDTEYTVTCTGDDSATIREIHDGQITATFTLPAAVVRALAPVLAEAISYDEPPVAGESRHTAGYPPAEVDPELERLLREEEEIARGDEPSARWPHAPSYQNVPLQVATSSEYWRFVMCGRCMCVIVNDVEGINVNAHTTWHTESG